MSRVLLDATVVIDALRGGPTAQRIRRLRSDGDTPFVCAVNVEEVWRGTTSRAESFVGRSCAAAVTAWDLQRGSWRESSGEGSPRAASLCTSRTV